MFFKIISRLIDTIGTHLTTPWDMICCSTDTSSSLYENLSRGLLSNVHVREGRGSASTLHVRDTCLPSVTLRNMLPGDTWGAHAREERARERIT